jgi:hypothetical protein
MEKQKALNSVWDYFLVKKNNPGVILGVNGEIIYSESGSECSLYTSEGHKCALGCLPLYMKDKEAAGILLEEFKMEPTMGLQRVSSKLNISFMFSNALQSAHDTAVDVSGTDFEEFRENIKCSLISVAEVHELTIPGDEP